MKKIIFILILFISASVYGQQIKTYYHTLNSNGTIDSGYVKFFTDSLFAYGSNAFVAHTVEHYTRIFGAEFPNNFGNYRLSADGIYRNYSQRTEAVDWNGVNNKPSTVTSLAGTNTGDQDLSGLLPKPTTSGVAASPTASSTQTITHNLGRIPSIIRIYGIGTFTANAAATPTPFSMGVFSSSGNTCVYMRSTGITTQVSQTSIVFSVFISTSSGNFISGVIQNVGATSFDIVWTETGTSVAQNFLWEAQ